MFQEGESAKKDTDQRAGEKNKRFHSDYDYAKETLFDII